MKRVYFFAGIFLLSVVAATNITMASDNKTQVQNENIRPEDRHPVSPEEPKKNSNKDSQKFPHTVSQDALDRSLRPLDPNKPTDHRVSSIGKDEIAGSNPVLRTVSSANLLAAVGSLSPRGRFSQMHRVSEDDLAVMAHRVLSCSFSDKR